MHVDKAPVGEKLSTSEFWLKISLRSLWGSAVQFLYRFSPNLTQPHPEHLINRSFSLT